MSGGSTSTTPGATVPSPGGGGGSLGKLKTPEQDPVFAAANEAAKLREEQERLHQSRLTEITKNGIDSRAFAALSADQKTLLARDTFLGGMASLENSSSKKLQAIGRAAARVNQAIAIKDAIVSTYQGVAKTLASGPFPLNLVFAAGQVAAGLGAVAKIRSQGFANGGTPPTDQVSIVGERGPELFVPKSRGTVVPNEDLLAGLGKQSDQAPVTNITNINVSAVDGESVARFFKENGRTLFATVQEQQKSTPGYA
jgi:hypothetical protein